MTPTDIFNTYLGPAGAPTFGAGDAPDLSGYGESLVQRLAQPLLFDAVRRLGRRASTCWSGAPASTRSRKFARSCSSRRRLSCALSPGGRKNTGVVVRRDSGWKAVGDGTFDLPRERDRHPSRRDPPHHQCRQRARDRPKSSPSTATNSRRSISTATWRSTVSWVSFRSGISWASSRSPPPAPTCLRRPTRMRFRRRLACWAGPSIRRSESARGPIAARVHRVGRGGDIGHGRTRIRGRGLDQPHLPGGGEGCSCGSRVRRRPEPVPPAQKFDPRGGGWVGAVAKLPIPLRGPAGSRLSLPTLRTITDWSTLPARSAHSSRARRIEATDTAPNCRRHRDLETGRSLRAEHRRRPIPARSPRCRSRTTLGPSPSTRSATTTSWNCLVNLFHRRGRPSHSGSRRARSKATSTTRAPRSPIPSTPRRRHPALRPRWRGQDHEHLGARRRHRPEHRHPGHV